MNAQFTTSVSGNTVYAINTTSNTSSCLWNFGNGQSSTAFTTSTSYTANGAYTITLVASNACLSDSVSSVVNICHWLAGASFTYSMSSTNTTTFTNVSVNSTAYFWDFGNGIQSNAQNPIVTYTSQGTYTILLIASNSCSSDTIMQLLSILDVGLADLKEEAGVGIYPNPSNGIFIIETQLSESIGLKVFASDGTLVYELKTIDKSQEMDLSHLSKGIYFVEFRGGEKRIPKKLILE